jgi:hypothetical protein
MSINPLSRDPRFQLTKLKKSQKRKKEKRKTREKKSKTKKVKKKKKKKRKKEKRETKYKKKTTWPRVFFWGLGPKRGPKSAMVVGSSGPFFFKKIKKF